MTKATAIVHWPSGPVYACAIHAKQLRALGTTMGIHVHIEPYSGDKPCANCANAQPGARTDD